MNKNIEDMEYLKDRIRGSLVGGAIGGIIGAIAGFSLHFKTQRQY